MHRIFLASTLFLLIIGLSKNLVNPIPVSEDASLNSLLITIALSYLLMSIPGSFMIYKFKLSRYRKEQSLKFILEGYRKAFLLRLALLEGATVLGLIAYLFTGRILLAVLSGFTLAFMFILRPSVEEVKSEFDLSDSNLNVLSNEEALLP